MCSVAASVVVILFQGAPENELSSRDLDGLVEQHEARRRACGPICAWHVLNTVGLQTDLNSLLEESRPGPEGVSLSSVAAMLRARGLRPKLIYVASRNADLLPRPAIIVVDETHAVVFHGWDADRMAVCFEPASGEIRRVPAASLKNQWSGDAIVLSRPPLSTAAVVAATWALVLSLFTAVAFVVGRRSRTKRTPAEPARG